MLGDGLVDHGRDIGAHLGRGAFAGGDSCFDLGVKNVEAFVEVFVNAIDQLGEFVRDVVQKVHRRLVNQIVDVFGPQICGVCGRGFCLTSISAVHDTLPFTLGEMAQHIIDPLRKGGTIVTTIALQTIARCRACSSAAGGLRRAHARSSGHHQWRQCSQQLAPMPQMTCCVLRASSA